MPTCKLDRISLQETFAMKLAATPTGSEKPPGQRTRRSWGFLLVTHWSGISGLRPRRSRFEKFQCPCMKPKPISRGRSAARAQAISPVRGPMLTSSRSFVIDCRKEIKVWIAAPLLAGNEQLGDLLLEQNQPEQALAAYEASLQLAPNRFNSLLGGGRAAELAGARSKAETYYSQLLALCKNAESQRPELHLAKSFLEKQAKLRP